MKNPDEQIEKNQLARIEQLEAERDELKQRLRDNSLVIQHPERRRIADRIEELEAERDELNRAHQIGAIKEETI